MNHFHISLYFVRDGALIIMWIRAKHMLKSYLLLSGEVGFFRGAAWVTAGLISLVPVYIPLSFVCSGRISMKESLVSSLQRGKKPMILNSKQLGWQLI